MPLSVKGKQVGSGAVGGAREAPEVCGTPGTVGVSALNRDHCPGSPKAWSIQFSCEVCWAHEMKSKTLLNKVSNKCISFLFLPHHSDLF